MDLHTYFTDLGRKGGQARARNLTAAQRSASARKAGKARGKQRSDEKAKPKKNGRA